MSTKYEMRSMLTNMKVNDLREVSQYFGESLTNQTGGYLNKKQLVNRLLGGTRTGNISRQAVDWKEYKCNNAVDCAALRNMITLGSGNTLYKRCYKNTPDDCAKLVELTGKYRVQQPVTQSGLVELEIAYKNIRMPVFMGGPSRWVTPDKLIWKRS